MPMREKMKKGGRRILRVSPQIMLDLCKAHDAKRRTYTVERALPDDARMVGGQIAWARGNMIEMVVESAEWQDDDMANVEYLDPPRFTVQYLDEAGEASEE